MKTMNFLRSVVAVTCAAALCLPTVGEASWLSDVTNTDVNFAEGYVRIDPPKPEQIPQLVRRAVETLPEAVAGAARDLFNPAGAGLAAAIRHARAQAERGASPVPGPIRARLSGFVPEDVLNNARWTTLDRSRVDLANLTLLHNNDVEAITVGHVIVFDRHEAAATDWQLWAHELFHTMQYASLGIEGFAHAYVASSRDMERDASSFADLVASRVEAREAGERPASIRYERSAVTGSDSAFIDSMRSAFRRNVPATACLEIDDNGGRPVVRNECDTPIWVTSFVEVDRRTGRSFPGVCTPQPGITCEIQPGTELPVVTPRGGCTVRVDFSFYEGGRQGRTGVWQGECAVAGVEGGTGMGTPASGQSCCMFQGGRCGPFLGQPAMPIGSPCSCQYSNPNASGTVCAP
ncbi:MAG: DUF4157 domain-containing protein [Holophagales bacterium]|nr:DUF4157 domain-containing protein [Holophagales bacterium]